MRQKIVAGNWKMNLDKAQAEKLTSEIVHMAQDELNGNVKLVLCPPFVHLSTVQRLLGGAKSVFLGAQNISRHEEGAYTGEIAANMLTSYHTQYVIIGHSERREYNHETDQELAQKVDVALKNNLIPIFCCGEPLEIRENETFIHFVTEQLTKGVFHLAQHDFEKLVLAYEPIWAIGTGKTASAEQAQEIHAAIRAHIATKYGQETADKTPILYGGSCKPSNAKELFACPDVDGGLIGGAALKSRDFVDIAKSF